MGISPIAVLIAIYAGVQMFGLFGIIKGPLGFIIIYETYQSITKRKLAQTLENEIVDGLD